MKLQIAGLRKSYGHFAAVRGIDFSVEEGEFLVILGPSGCGKTTTLRCLAGLEEPDSGDINIGPDTVFSARQSIFVPPERRNIGMIFQSYALWPHMTVFENVAFPLRARGKRNGAEVRRRVSDVLALVGLEALGERSASLLSGGQMQRVAFARALACEPAALLLDEPLSNLDLRLRQRLREELKDIQRKSGSTSVLVTHDQTEAAALADRVIVMKDGQIVQNATPEELFATPANRFVADFLGIGNLFPIGRIEQVGPTTYRGYLADETEIMADCTSAAARFEKAFIWFRAEDLRIVHEGKTTTTPGQFLTRVVSRSFTGTDYLYDLQMDGRRQGSIVMSLRTGEKFDVGAAVTVALVANCAHIIPDDFAA